MIPPHNYAGYYPSSVSPLRRGTRGARLGEENGQHMFTHDAETWHHEDATSPGWRQSQWHPAEVPTDANGTPGEDSWSRSPVSFQRPPAARFYTPAPSRRGACGQGYRLLGILAPECCSMRSSVPT